LYAVLRTGFDVELTAAFPRHAPITVAKIVGIEIPKNVSAKIFHDLVFAG